MLLQPALRQPDDASDAFTPDDLKHYGIVLERSRLNENGLKALDAMMAYNNPFVIERFMTDNQITDLEYATACFTALKQYLAVCVLTNGKRTPSKIIDEMWHSFILHMRDYESYCRVHLRQTVYHDPAQPRMTVASSSITSRVRACWPRSARPTSGSGLKTTSASPGAFRPVFQRCACSMTASSPCNKP